YHSGLAQAALAAKSREPLWACATMSLVAASEHTQACEPYLSEPELLSRFHHPNIMPVAYSLGQDGLVSMCMPLCKDTLGSWLNKSPQRTIHESVSLLKQAAAALQYVHDKGY